jgi:hypothetical protein
MAFAFDDVASTIHQSLAAGTCTGPSDSGAYVKFTIAQDGTKVGRCRLTFSNPRFLS